MMGRSGSRHAVAEIAQLLRPHWKVLSAATPAGMAAGMVAGMVGGAGVTGLLATIDRGLQESGGTSASLLFAFVGLMAERMVRRPDLGRLLPDVVATALLGAGIMVAAARAGWRSSPKRSRQG